MHRTYKSFVNNLQATILLSQLSFDIYRFSGFKKST